MFTFPAVAFLALLSASYGDICNLNNGMTDEARNTLLRMHNKFRYVSLITCKVKPSSAGRAKAAGEFGGFASKAAKMMKLVLNPRELRIVLRAERSMTSWLDQCHWVHSSIEDVGENIYMTTKTKENMTVRISKYNNFDEFGSIPFHSTTEWFHELKDTGVGQANILTDAVFGRGSVGMATKHQFWMWSEMVCLDECAGCHYVK
ncbi:unnamed protein product [Haemonchus placei]|uniref:SCP domain-containing protein n=1 Tax=Haemonchus placei TaxID=6290 RepID=A0A0N4X5X6_HAEPC|nr:unnamed protein product [Haemonchus placei]